MTTAPEALDPRLTPERMRQILQQLMLGCECCEPEPQPQVQASRFHCEPLDEIEP